MFMGSIFLIFGGVAVLLLFFLLGSDAGFCGVFFDDVVVICAFHLGSLPAFLVDHSLLFFVFFFFGGGLLVTCVDQAHNFFMLQLIQTQFFLLLFQDELLPLQFILQFLPFPLQRSDFLIALFLYFRPLVLQLLDLILQLRDDLLIDLLTIGFLLF